MTKYNLIIIVLFLFINIVNENLTNGIYEIKYQDLYLNFHRKNNKFYFLRKCSFSNSSLKEYEQHLKLSKIPKILKMLIFFYLWLIFKESIFLEFPFFKAQQFE